MYLSEFVAVAGNRNAHIVLDSTTDELKAYRRDFFSRAVQWIRERISPNTHRQLEQDGAYNLFMSAIADHAAYSTRDVNHAYALLATDAEYNEPLTSRRIRHVIQELDGRSTQTLRDNRITASYMSSRGIDMRLREQDSPVELSRQDRESLAERIREAIHEAGGNGSRKVEFVEANAITEELVDDLIARKTAELRAAEEASAQAESSAQAEVAARSTGDGDANQAPAQPQGAVPEAASARPEQDAAVAPRELLRELDSAGLPKQVRNQVRNAVRSGEIDNVQDLARDANRRMANWVMSNRMGKWCGEIQMRLGLVRNLKHGELVTAPSSLFDRIRETVESPLELLPYSEIKARARAQIDACFREEAGQRQAGV